MDQVEAFILAGGASSRMGSDKSQLLIQGQTFTERIAQTIQKLLMDVTIVGHTGVGSHYKTVADVYPKWGALGGVHAALVSCKTSWALIIACDLPFITSDLLTRLASLRADFEAVIPIQADGRPQPLCAFYKIDPCLKVTERLIANGRRRPLDLIQTVNSRLVSFAEVQDLGGSERFFVNINTPEDYYEVTKGAAVDL